MAKIFSMIGNSHRYLVLFVNKDSNEIGVKKHMKDSEWLSLQTRSLTDIHNIPTHKYQSFAKIPEMQQKINVKSRNETQTTYECENFPLLVTLLHTRKNYTMQYPDTGNIMAAVETYQTIINFK